MGLWAMKYGIQSNMPLGLGNEEPKYSIMIPVYFSHFYHFLVFLPFPLSTFSLNFDSRTRESTNKYMQYRIIFGGIIHVGKYVGCVRRK